MPIKVPSGPGHRRCRLLASLRRLANNTTNMKVALSACRLLAQLDGWLPMDKSSQAVDNALNNDAEASDAITALIRDLIPAGRPKRNSSTR